MRPTLFFLLLTLSAGAQTRRFTVGIGGLMHESNSFNPTKTTLADFGPDRGTSGEDVLKSWRSGNTELAGYLEGADQERFDVFQGYFASATPK